MQLVGRGVCHLAILVSAPMPKNVGALHLKLPVHVMIVISFNNNNNNNKIAYYCNDMHYALNRAIIRRLETVFYLVVI